MTNDDELFDLEDREDNSMENENDEALNEAYDKVSGSGVMPSLDEFLGSDYHDPASGAFEYSDGIGDVVGDPRISDSVIDEAEGEADGSSSDNDDDKPSDKITPMSILGGTFFKSERFSRNIPFLILCCIMGFVYIACRNNAESIIRKNLALQKEVRDLRAVSITVAGQLMDISKETEVAKRVLQRNIGIHEQNTPPWYFVIDKYEGPDSLKKDVAPRKDYINDFNDFEDSFK